MKTQQRIITWAILTVLTLSMLANTAFAQEATELQVAPTRQELTMNPGEDTLINVRFYNLSSSPISGIVKVADFIVEDKQGTPRIIDEANQKSPRFAASHWFDLTYDQVTIPAGEKVIIPAKIKVPVNARPGGRYAAVYFEPTSGGTKIGSGNEGNTGIATRIAGLVYIRVAGNALEKALISRFCVPSFYEYGPITLQTEITNRGDYHVRPAGVVSLTNIFGGVVDQQKLTEQNIFPDTERVFTNTFGSKWMIGRYRVDLTASYGDKGQALTKYIYVWVFPWRVATAIILSLIVLFLLAKKAYVNVVKKEANLESELEKERKEIEDLKKELKNKE